MTTSIRPGSDRTTPAGIAEDPAADAVDEATTDGRAVADGVPADPVKALIRRHRTLCAGAVDALEIAAGLEARGITDRVAAEYRHRDVFTLAEELHARVERATEPPPGAPRPEPEARHGTCAALRAGWGPAGAPAWVWLLGYGLVGDRVLALLLHGRHGLPTRALLASAVSAAAPTALALACAVAPAAWCAHWFAGHARRVLASSRSLDEFGGRVRPALLVAVVVFLGALLVFLWPARAALPPDAAGGTPPALACAAVAALGMLLFLARLLAAHGLRGAAGTAVLAAVAAEAVPLVTLLAARLPGCEALRWPVGWPAGAFGPAVVPLVACALPALALLAHALLALSRASVHGAPDRHAPRTGRALKGAGPAGPVPLGAAPVPKA
ncbi:hypothetical protein [Streptomyces cinnamoneus]|uniref:hypothetical protein n=1 Tax=Streptomyces cinnamoneus TaxID=53446 RepID=UPI0015E2F38A|nr:hypothetical protein [Streptomyces cinnamoneus]